MSRLFTNHSFKYIKQFVLAMGLLALYGCSSLPGGSSGKHLFILTGQSNMQMLNPAQSFTPAVQKAFGEDKVIVVKQARGTMPIRVWLENWPGPKDPGPQASRYIIPDGHLYKRLINKLRPSLEQQTLASITVVWMQGETDAAYKNGDYYHQGLKDLVAQFERDLDSQQINMVVGRISDFDLGSKRFKHWDQIRQIQESFADANPRYTWVDTDDLNDNIGSEERKAWKKRTGQHRLSKNDLHYSEAGFEVLGKRFAQAAIQLIKDNN